MAIALFFAIERMNFDFVMIPEIDICILVYLVCYLIPSTQRNNQLASFTEKYFVHV